MNVCSLLSISWLKFRFPVGTGLTLIQGFVYWSKTIIPSFQRKKNIISASLNTPTNTAHTDFLSLFFPLLISFYFPFVFLLYYFFPLFFSFLIPLFFFFSFILYLNQKYISYPFKNVMRFEHSITGGPVSTREWQAGFLQENRPPRFNITSLSSILINQIRRPIWISCDSRYSDQELFAIAFFATCRVLWSLTKGL